MLIKVVNAFQHLFITILVGFLHLFLYLLQQAFLFFQIQFKIYDPLTISFFCLILNQHACAMVFDPDKSQVFLKITFLIKVFLHVAFRGHAQPLLLHYRVFPRQVVGMF